VITLEYSKFCLVNVYKPSTSGNLEKRLPFKQAFDAEFLTYLSDLKQRLRKPIVLCGDFNVAHTVSAVRIACLTMQGERFGQAFRES
jgi:exonuclease III